MSRIEIGRYSEMLRRMLGQKGQEIVAAELSPEVSATIQLESPAPEWDFLKSVRRCHVVTSLPIAAGFDDVTRLRNPADSGVIATLLGITGTVTLGVGLWSIATGVQAGDLVSAANTVVPDGRWGATGITDTALIATTNNAADAIGPSGDNIAIFEALNETPNEYHYPFVLMPGFAVDWGTLTTNRGFRSFAVWTERRLPPLEA